MLHRLSLAQRLLLIYLLSLASVAVLAYSLVAEKNVAIEFAKKEQRGSAFLVVVRNALLAIIENDITATRSRSESAGIRKDFSKQASAIEAAEQQYGRDLNTAEFSAHLAILLRQMDAPAETGRSETGVDHAAAAKAARLLMSRIADSSNLVLDPDLDSYYLMSVVVLRLPDFLSAAWDLANAYSAGQRAPSEAPSVGEKLLSAKGALAAAAKALASDNAEIFKGATNKNASRTPEISFLHNRDGATEYASRLPDRLAEAAPAELPPLLAEAVATMKNYWQSAAVELDKALQLRVERLNRRMALDLTAAALIWLVALSLILIIARQITRPIRELAAVAERVRYGEGYNLRAKSEASGEVGSLIAGFNAMLDRLQHETSREQERVASDRAAAAQRQLIEAIPAVISVISEADGRVLYSNMELRQPSWLPVCNADSPGEILALLHPSDRAAFLERLRAHGQVDGFEARCQAENGEPLWVLIASRPMLYQGEAARLDVYTPISDRKRAEAALARRNAVLAAITYAATRIIGAPDWRSAMPELLSRLGMATDVSRVYFFEMHPAPDGKGLAQSCRFAWEAPGLRPLLDDPRFQNDPIGENDDPQFTEWFQRRSRGEVIQVTLSNTTGAARTLFEETNTRSMLSVPIMVEDRLWGSIGFDDCRAERIWSEVEIDLLKTAVALIAGAIERAKSDGKLRERETELIEAQRIAHVGSWELDFNTDQVTWSDEGWRIFGLEPGRRHWAHNENLERIHPDDRARVREADAAAKNARKQIDIEYRILRPGGEIRVVHERAESVCDDVGRPVRLIGTIHDVTELKATEARLRQSEERYALAARGADVGLWDWDIVADRAYLSPRLHEIIGVKESTRGQSIFRMLDAIQSEDVAALQKYLATRYTGHRRRFEFEVRTRKPAEAPRWLILRGLIVYTDGKPRRLVGSLADITDRKRAEEQVALHREALYQSEKMAMFGSLLAGVAHELNNPLSTVIGQTVLLQQTVNDPAVIRRAERIRNASERCARIVRTFLSMARQRQAEPKPVDINKIIETAVELLAYQLRSANIRVDLDLAEDLPKAIADADQIHQVLMNLIINARQALAATAGAGAIRIETHLDPSTQQIEISVRDNGPGVPPELRKRIFDPFFTTKPIGEGTGIGLSLCSSIMRGHGGRIDVSEAPGGGALFTMMLPLGVSGGSDQDKVDSDRAPVSLRILVVDDETEVVDTLSEILRNNGHTIDVAANGREGLERALSTSYDLILSDMRMPLLDGPCFYREIQHQRPAMLDRFAFITGDTLSPEIKSFLNRTGARCVEKPFIPDDVLGLISRLKPLNATGRTSPHRRSRATTHKGRL